MRMRRIISIMLSLALALAVCGCRKSSSDAVQGAAEGTDQGAATAKDTTVKTYESDDGWKMDYDTDYIAVNKVEGKVIFSYTGDAGGTNEVAVFYMPTKQPQDALYDLTLEYDDAQMTRSEGYIGASWEDWAFFVLVDQADDNPKENKVIKAAEHNGGALVIDTTYSVESDEEKGMDISDAMSSLLDTFEFTNHEPQAQYAYVPGKYQREYFEEIEGEKQLVTDEIVLNSDHTGSLSFQDDIEIYWTSYEIVETESGNRYEYSIEGDYIYVNLAGDEWTEFIKKE